MDQLIRMTRTVLMVMTAAFYFSGSAAAQKSQAIDACTLLSKGEIQAAVSETVSDGKVNTTANTAVGAPCEYKVGDFGVFSILIKAVGPGESAEKVMAELKKMKIAVSDAPGIGDRSFFSSPGYGMLQLNTFKSSHYLIITMLVPGAAEVVQKTAAENLMHKALSKI